MIVASYRNTERSIRERETSAQIMPDVVEEARRLAVDIIANANQRADEIVTQARQWAKSLFETKVEPVPAEANMPSVKAIIQEVADRTGVPVSEIKGPKRFMVFVEARFDAIAAVYVARPDLSLPQIGRIFNRDHTTILHAVQVRGVWRKPGNGHQPGQAA